MGYGGIRVTVVRYSGPLVVILGWLWLFLSYASSGYALAEERQSREVAEACVVALQTQVARLAPTPKPCPVSAYAPDGC